MSIPNKTSATKCSKETHQWRLRSRVGRPCPRVRDQNPPRTPPPRSPTPAPAATASSPAQASAIRRGAAGRGEGWPRESADPRTAAAREPVRCQPRRPSSSPARRRSPPRCGPPDRARRRRSSRERGRAGSARARRRGRCGSGPPRRCGGMRGRATGDLRTEERGDAFLLFRFGRSAKWVVHLSEPLESVFGRQIYCRGRILGLHFVVGRQSKRE